MSVHKVLTTRTALFGRSYRDKWNTEAFLMLTEGSKSALGVLWACSTSVFGLKDGLCCPEERLSSAARYRGLQMRMKSHLDAHAKKKVGM